MPTDTAGRRRLCKRLMKKETLTHDWELVCVQTGGTKTVSLPYDAMLDESRSVKSAGMHHVGWFEGRDYIYRRKIMLDPSYSTVILETEGAYNHPEIYIDGVKAGGRDYGYTDFFTDITSFTKGKREAVIEIHTFNSDQPNSRWYTGTGLYRPVHLYTAKEEAILPDSVRVTTVKAEGAAADVHVQAEILLAGHTETQAQVVCRVFDKEKCIKEAAMEICSQEDDGANTGKGRINPEGERDAGSRVRTVGALLHMEGIGLWSADSPKMYRLEISTENDRHSLAFGIRTVHWGKDGLSVNGKREILRGACIHHDNGLLGAASFLEAEYRRVRLLKECGYNAVRSAHNPCSKALLEACDTLGMYVLDEYTDMWYIHKTKYDYASFMEKNWQSDLYEMAAKDYNHPSVIMYSTGNEVAETGQKKGIRLVKMMTEYLHSLDATRPVTCGVNIFFNMLYAMGFGVYSDDKSEKAAKKNKPVGSEFYNKLAGLLGDKTMKFGATLYPCDVLARDAFANMDIAGYNYGIMRYARDLKKYKNRLILGTETFCADAYDFYEQAKKEKRIVGDFVWAGMDYIGEAGIGAWEYENYAPKNADPSGWLTAGSGRLDITGYPNAEALYTRVAFEQTKDIYIAVKPLCVTGSHSPSAWKLTEAIPSWSYEGFEGKKAHVEVYARASKVILFCNRKKVGVRRTSQAKNGCRFLFEIPYESGVLQAAALDENDNLLARCTLRSANKSTVLYAQPERGISGIEGKGSIVYIPVFYGDENGIYKPAVDGRLRIQTKGCRLLGFGNGCPYNPSGYRNCETDTYYGRALVIVIKEDEEAEVTVTDGCRTVQCTV